MEVVCSGAQYRQNPHLWDDPLTPERAQYPENRLRGEKRVSRSTPGQGFFSKTSFLTVSLGRE
jgi:hypothetical protein